MIEVLLVILALLIPVAGAVAFFMGLSTRTRLQALEAQVARLVHGFGPMPQTARPYGPAAPFPFHDANVGSPAQPPTSPAEAAQAADAAPGQSTRPDVPPIIEPDVAAETGGPVRRPHLHPPLRWFDRPRDTTDLGWRSVWAPAGWCGSAVLLWHSAESSLCVTRSRKGLSVPALALRWARCWRSAC